jgi:hypothetical protein
MGPRWSDGTVQIMIGGMHQLTLKLCMIAVAASHMDGKMICTVLSSFVHCNKV